MISIALSEAKAQLSSLIGHVREGQEYEITHHGKPVARLVPAVQAPSAASVARAIQALKTTRKGVKLGRTGGTTLKDLPHQGYR